MGEPEVRVELAKWIKAAIAGESEVMVPDLAKEMAARLMGNHEAAMALLYPAVADMVRQVVGATRGFIMAGDHAMTPEAIKDRGKRLESKWLCWLEHVNDRHKLLPEMTRDDLLAAAAEREERAATELQIAGLWRLLASRLTMAQRVCDVFSAAEIEAAFASMQQRGGGAAA